MKALIYKFKNLQNKILFVVIAVVVGGVTVYASITILSPLSSIGGTGFRLPADSQYYQMTAQSDTKCVNNTGSLDMFVPGNSSAEWQAFFNNAPNKNTTTCVASCMLSWGVSLPSGQSTLAYKSIIALDPTTHYYCASPGGNNQTTSCSVPADTGKIVLSNQHSAGCSGNNTLPYGYLDVCLGQMLSTTLSCNNGVLSGDTSYNIPPAPPDVITYSPINGCYNGTTESWTSQVMYCGTTPSLGQTSSCSSASDIGKIYLSGSFGSSSSYCYGEPGGYFQACAGSCN